MFVAEKKNWEAATNNNPKLSSKNDDRAEFHHSEIVRRGVCLGCSSGDASSGIDARSPPAGNSESGDNNACGVSEG